MRLFDDERAFTTRYIVAMAIYLAAQAGIVLAVPVVPGYTVETYAQVVDPNEITFDPAGVMYAGRENLGSGGGAVDAVRIHRIGIGGSPVVEYGNFAIPDPDSVLFDAAGVFSGTPGSVLVGGVTGGGGSGGTIRAILPNGAVTDLWGPTSLFTNPHRMTLDRMGRLLFVSAGQSGVFFSDGSFPQVLFDAPFNIFGIAIDHQNRIFVKGGGTISLYESNGTLVDASFATGLTAAHESVLAVGEGGIWGNDLYTISGDQLLRFDNTGTATIVGTGFDGVDIAFGPDSAMYISQFSADQILRIAPEPTTLVLLMLGALAAGRRHRREAGKAGH